MLWTWWLACSQQSSVVPSVVDETDTTNSDTDTDADSDADSDVDTETDTDTDAFEVDSADTSDTASLSTALVPATNACSTATVTWFDDVTMCAGLGDAWHATVPTLSHPWFVTGQAFGDVDNDGWMDVVVAGQALGNHLYLGGPDGLFVERTDPAIATVESGGVSMADADGDGWLDLFITGRDNDWLFMNDQGDFPAFADPGPGGAGMGMGGSWADLEGNGTLDLYIANYLCAECNTAALTPAEQSRDRLMMQDASGWHDRTDYLAPVADAGGMGFASIWSDFDDDGDLDLYVVNDKGTPGDPEPDWVMNRNVYWRNDGPGCSGICFTEISQSNGTDLRVDGMGVDVADYDGDLDLDIAVTDTNQVYILRNDGGVFTDVSTLAGLGPEVITWGVVWLDADNDGWVDLFVSSGLEDHLYMNQQDGTFVDQAVTAGLADSRATYGVAISDYDRDGRMDLLVGDVGWSYRLMRNQHPNTHHWVGLRLVGQGAGGPGAVGAKVYAMDDSGRVQMREVHAGHSLGTSSDPGVHFGFGDATPTQVRIVWPDGVESLQPVTPDTWAVMTR